MTFQKPNKNGFTLLEIMIAMTVFSMFVTAFVVSQGNNLADSSNMRFEYQLKNLLEKEVNEIIINPPEFTPGLLITNENDYKTIEDFEEYEKKVEWFEFLLPDLSQLNKKEGSEDSESNQQDTIQTKITDSVSKNLKLLLWQLRVTIRHKETQKQMEATTWLVNQKAKVQFEGF
jgi:prepilin-type N-terminal cleavage/methylation domain-containing protein